MTGFHGHMYVGQASHHVVMANFLLRGYVAAIPDIDIGWDLFVVDGSGPMSRVQVKGALYQPSNQRFEFKVRKDVLSDDAITDGHFVFAILKDESWNYLIMTHKQLGIYVNQHGCGHEKTNSNFRHFQISNKLSCSKTDWAKHLNDWSSWPEIRESRRKEYCLSARE